MFQTSSIQIQTFDPFNHISVRRGKVLRYAETPFHWQLGCKIGQFVGYDEELAYENMLDLVTL
jgi:hypothetical protein